eukprot:1056934-Prorocentrum_minimum.AAC.1
MYTFAAPLCWLLSSSLTRSELVSTACRSAASAACRAVPGGEGLSKVYVSSARRLATKSAYACV